MQNMEFSGIFEYLAICNRLLGVGFLSDTPEATNVLPKRAWICERVGISLFQIAHITVYYSPNVAFLCSPKIGERVLEIQFLT